MNNELRITNKENKKTKKRSMFYVLRSAKAGFTLIFAVLIGSLLVAIAVSISNIAMKQLAISAVSRESQIAFYAADGGAECALYWDVQGPYLTTPFSFAGFDPNLPSIIGTMSCGVNAVTPTSQIFYTPRDDINYYENNFTVYYEGSPRSCAVVSLKKYSDKNVIDSFGVNDCSNTENKYRVERAIRVEYK